MSEKEKTEYKRNFNVEKYDRVGLYLKLGEKKRYKAIAKQAGMSLNAYIIQAVEEKIEREKGESHENKGNTSNRER